MQYIHSWIEMETNVSGTTYTIDFENLRTDSREKNVIFYDGFKKVYFELKVGVRIALSSKP
jgi:hypothetical protein